MATSNNNVVMYGTSGKIGDLLIFRRRAGKTLISKIGQRSKALTAKQIAINEKFKLAAAYAKFAMQNATIKELYNQKAGPGVFPYNVALADYFNAPKIVETNYAAYTGLPNSTIRIMATDDFKVAGVRVAIISAGGAQLEEGEAILDGSTGYYVYTALQTNNTLPATTIEVTVTDMANNSTVQETIIP